MTARGQGQNAARSKSRKAAASKSEQAARSRSRKAAPGRKRRGRKRSPQSRRFWAALAVGGLGLLVAVAGLLGWAALPGPGSGRPVNIDWPRSVGPSQAARLLSARGVIASPRLFALYLWLVGGCPYLRPGPHLLSDSLAPRALLQRLARTPSRPQVKVTIPEGYNYIQIAERLEDKQICSSRAFRRAASTARLLAELGIRGATAEGYLFPATYRLQVDSHPDRVARVLVAEMRQRLEKLHRSHAGAFERLRRDHNWGELQVLTLASIVEKEARHPQERATIAGVYFNRLTDPEFVPPRRLQADPTAAYGFWSLSGRLPVVRALTVG